jgi:hypothetical protein
VTMIGWIIVPPCLVLALVVVAVTLRPTAADAVATGLRAAGAALRAALTPWRLDRTPSVGPEGAPRSPSDSDHG